MNRGKDQLRIRLNGKHLERYRQIKNNKKKLCKPDTRVVSETCAKIRICHLTPAQRIKFLEMLSED